jgi:hypothetical protein
LNQHDLMVQVLIEAGGRAAESAVPRGYKGRVADVLFGEDDVIVEVKSLTTDRANDPEVGQAVGEMFAKSTHLGAPVILETVAVNLHDLDPRVAANTLRIVGQRVRNATKSANDQIKKTKVALDRPNALGVLMLVTPPFKLDRKSIIWTAGDEMRDGRCSGIDLVFMVETPLAAPEPETRRANSFLSMHPRADRGIPKHLVEAIDQAWGRVTGQFGVRADDEDFHKYGATS